MKKNCRFVLIGLFVLMFDLMLGCNWVNLSNYVVCFDCFPVLLDHDGGGEFAKKPFKICDGLQNHPKIKCKSCRAWEMLKWST